MFVCRAVAKVRADAVQIVEQIEDSAHEAIIDAKKAAKQSEKVAMKGLLAATTAEGVLEVLFVHCVKNDTYITLQTVPS